MSASSFEVLVRRTNLEFPLRYNQLFLCHWNGQLNFRNCKNLFRSSLSVSLIKCFLFLCYSNMITNRKFWCQGLTNALNESL